MQSRPKKKRETVYVFQVAFLAPPPEKQIITIHRPPEPYYTGTLTQWCDFLESKNGKKEIAKWWRGIEDGLYQEIVITQFELQGRLVLPRTSKTTLRLIKTK